MRLKILNYLIKKFNRHLKFFQFETKFHKLIMKKHIYKPWKVGRSLRTTIEKT
jgi:hypothetical protein